MGAKRVAATAIVIALLLCAQLVLGALPGVELVSVILLCFCYAFGASYGMIAASAFSLLRCILFGFLPNVVLLYLLYYNLFALLFGSLNGRKLPVWLCPLLLGLLAALSAFFAQKGAPVALLYQTRLRVLAWALFALCLLLLLLSLLSLVLKKRGECVRITALAVFCTVLFTLLDDVITPLMLGFGVDASVAYFYASFLTMLPQTVTVGVSVFLLFPPLSTLFIRFANGERFGN